MKEKEYISNKPRLIAAFFISFINFCFLFKPNSFDIEVGKTLGILSYPYILAISSAMSSLFFISTLKGGILIKSFSTLKPREFRISLIFSFDISKPKNLFINSWFNSILFSSSTKFFMSTTL